MKKRLRNRIGNPSIEIRPIRKDWLGVREKDGRILIAPDQGEKDMLDTLVHELLHRYFWELPEKTVIRVANDMAICLWRMGYRRKYKVKKMKLLRTDKR